MTIHLIDVKIKQTIKDKSIKNTLRTPVTPVTEWLHRAKAHAIMQDNVNKEVGQLPEVGSCVANELLHHYKVSCKLEQKIKCCQSVYLKTWHKCNFISLLFLITWRKKKERKKESGEQNLIFIISDVSSLRHITRYFLVSHPLKAFSVESRDLDRCWKWGCHFLARELQFFPI